MIASDGACDLTAGHAPFNRRRRLPGARLASRGFLGAADEPGDESSAAERTV